MIHSSFQPVMCNFLTAYFLMLSDGIKKYAVSYVVLWYTVFKPYNNTF